MNAIVDGEAVARGARDDEPVAVVSSATARRATGGSPPLGERAPRKA